MVSNVLCYIEPGYKGKSLVLTALCGGLEEILQKYHKDVCELEQKALQMDPLMPVTKMRYILREYYQVFKGEYSRQI